MPDEQPVRLNAPTPGELLLSLDGQEYRLRRVFLDELERFMLALAELQESLGEAPEGLSPRQQLERAFEDRRALVTWWREVIETLAPAGAPPLPERLPAWLASGELASEVVAMWQGSPLAPGA